jgi:hypothetical protein
MLKNSYLQPHLPTHSPTRSWRAIVASAVLACALFAIPIYAAAQAKPSLPGAEA